jgi:hypothetical protein
MARPSDPRRRFTDIPHLGRSRVAADGGDRRRNRPAGGDGVGPAVRLHAWNAGQLAQRLLDALLALPVLVLALAQAAVLSLSLHNVIMLDLATWRLRPGWPWPQVQRSFSPC